MNTGPGVKSHSTLRQVQDYIKEYLNQEELKQRKDRCNKDFKQAYALKIIQEGIWIEE